MKTLPTVRAPSCGQSVQSGTLIFLECQAMLITLRENVGATPAVRAEIASRAEPASALASR